MSCVARPHQTPIGAASNFLQRKWVSCSKSYWQGYECYDLAWYKDMEAPCFPQPNLWLAGCASRSWAALRKFVVLSTQRLRVGKKTFHSIAGGKRGRSCRCSGCAVCCVCSVLFRLALSCAVLPFAPSCEMVRNGARWCRQAAAGKQQQASSSGKQQQQAASSKQQAAAGAAAGKQQASSRQAASKQASKPASQQQQQAAGKQQPAFAPLKEWTNIIKL